MSAFDDLTLGEVETLSAVALNGQSMAEGDPMMIAGAVMWTLERRNHPELEWEHFKANVKMGDIKAFSIQMEADELVDPPSVLPVPQN